METKRISMAGVLASSGGSMVAAAAVLLSTTLVFADPDGTLDLPLAPLTYNPQPTPPVPPTLDDDDGDTPDDTPPPTFFGEEIDSDTDSILYVIDNSGSMSITVQPFTDADGNIQTGSRLDRAKAELRRSIGDLPESFEFNIFFYDECVSSCWNDKQPATPANKQAAFGWIDQIQPDGWTNTGLAVQTALTDKDNHTVVLLSDGSPNFLDCAMNYVGSYQQHSDLISAENTQGAVINAFGIGVSSDPNARGFMQGIAANNGGSYIDID